MDAARLQVSGRRPRGGTARSGEGRQGGAEGLGGGITAGKNGVGRGSDGLVACHGLTCLRRDSSPLRAALEFCVRPGSGMCGSGERHPPMSFFPP